MRRLSLRLAWVGALLAVAAVAAAIVFWPRRAEVPRNLLLVSIDTLRSDRLGSYGYAGAVTPALDALAARGVRFADAWTVTPLTLPAHTSLLTGTFPMAHGVRDNGGFYVGDDEVTLAEVLRSNGFRTGGFVGAFVLDGRWGLKQGFETYVDQFDLSRQDLPGMDAIQRRGADVVDRALTWIAADGSRPFFAFVHLYDPHTPYEAPEPIRSRFPATLGGRYDAEIAYTDTQVARLLEALSRDGRLDETLVVVVGDHGEALGGHEEATHGFFVYEESLRVPFITAGPGLEPRVVTDPVRLVDVMPTVLDLLRVSIPKEVQGASLLPALAGQRLELLGFAESWYPRHHYGWSELQSVRDGRFKFILAPRRELYDLQADPGETTNIAERNTGAAQALERALRDFTARMARADARQEPRPVDPEVEERLRALGYVGASVSRRALEERLRGDPKDKIGLYTLLRQAGQDSTDGSLDAAIAKVRQALATDPEIVEAHVMLGNLHVKSGQLPEAIVAYQRALQLDEEHLGATVSLAMTYKGLGRLDAAEAGFERALAIDPRDGRSLFHLADLHLQRQQFADAEALLTRALDAGTDRPPVLLKLGECYLEMQRLDDAERTIRAALEARPRIPQGHYDLALVHEARGRPQEAIAEYEAEVAAYPEHYSASFNLAKLLQSAGRSQEALSRYRQAVHANPDFAEGQLYLAKALLDAGDLIGAEGAALKGLALQPNPRIAALGHFVLADVYNRLARPRDADRHLAAARALSLKR